MWQVSTLILFFKKQKNRRKKTEAILRIFFMQLEQDYKLPAKKVVTNQNSVA